MAYNRNLYSSDTSALDAGIIYDQNRQQMQDEINAGLIDGDIVAGLADNLASDQNQYSTDTFVERTTGGTASLSDGDGYLVLIRGNYEHTGFIPQSVIMTVDPALREEGEDDISATIDADIFISQMSSASGTWTTAYDGTSWSNNPATYGITVSGIPISGDEITVAYVKEVRGTIIQSNPQTFTSTGWNLYNHTNGYAKVLNYKENARFGITGTYTSVQLSTTLTGAKSTVTPDENGTFGVPSDYDSYYIWVNGGNATDTAVWMCWTDWTTQANGGVWQAYSEDTIDFSSIISTYFPNGLMAVGGYKDEVDFSLGKATNNVAKIAYSVQNLAEVKALNVDYEYDENYIYYGLSTPTVTLLSLSSGFNKYAAYDHGMEWFTGSDVEVYAQTLYGVNLKNNLERDVLTISQQTLSESEKNQVQQNITKDINVKLTISANGTGVKSIAGMTADHVLDSLQFYTDSTFSTPSGNILADISWAPGAGTLSVTVANKIQNCYALLCFSYKPVEVTMTIS